MEYTIGVSVRDVVTNEMTITTASFTVNEPARAGRLSRLLRRLTRR